MNSIILGKRPLTASMMRSCSSRSPRTAYLTGDELWNELGRELDNSANQERAFARGGR
ncbi:MAG TPA: hypothetical protein VM580_29130 [Labilithrix sp.]|jgi:hypothetical protein|nr:hypothetical protein [Labilithrix sp.]